MPLKPLPFDLRTAIGLLFTLYGVLLVVRGAVTAATPSVRSLGININLIWGAVLLAFGVGLLLVTLVSKGRKQGPKRDD